MVLAVTDILLIIHDFQQIALPIHGRLKLAAECTLSASARRRATGSAGLGTLMVVPWASSQQALLHGAACRLICTRSAHSFVGCTDALPHVGYVALDCIKLR